MITLDWGTVRVFLHVLAATVWVGGQLTLAALVPALRALGTDVTRTAARAFNRVAWPAFAVLVSTGIWNVIAQRGADGTDTTSYRVTLTIKLILVVMSGTTAYLHTRARRRTALAIYGALSGVSALAALFVGVVLAG